MAPPWVTTADDPQVAMATHVNVLAQTLSAALVIIKHEVDNPVVGAHCKCKVEEQDDFDCLGFCEERDDWEDAEIKGRYLELMERPLKALLLQVNTCTPAQQKPVYRGVLAGVQKLLDDKTFTEHSVLHDAFSSSTVCYDMTFGLLPELKEFLLESDQLEEEAHAEGQRHQAHTAALEAKNHEVVEQQFKAGALKSMKLEDFKQGLDLRSFCENHGLKKSGKKDEVIARIAAYFGETAEALALRQKYAAKQAEATQGRQRANARRAQETRERAEMEEGYCCNTPNFDYHAPPAGMITFANGSGAETWRCLSCGKIPPMPNAKGARMEEFSDNSDSDW